MTNKLQQPHLPSCLMGNNCNCPVGYGDNRASSEAQEWTVTPIHSKHSGHTDVIIACVLDTGISEYRFNDDGGSVYAALKDVTDAHNAALAAGRDAFASKHPTSFVRIGHVKELLDEVRKPLVEALEVIASGLCSTPSLVAQNALAQVKEQ